MFTYNSQELYNLYNLLLERSDKNSSLFRRIWHRIWRSKEDKKEDEFVDAMLTAFAHKPPTASGSESSSSNAKENSTSIEIEKGKDRDFLMLLLQSETILSDQVTDKQTKRLIPNPLKKSCQSVLDTMFDKEVETWKLQNKQLQKQIENQEDEIQERQKKIQTLEANHKELVLEIQNLRKENNHLKNNNAVSNEANIALKKAEEALQKKSQELTEQITLRNTILAENKKLHEALESANKTNEALKISQQKVELKNQELENKNYNLTIENTEEKLKNTKLQKEVLTSKEHLKQISRVLSELAITVYSKLNFSSAEKPEPDNILELEMMSDDKKDEPDTGKIILFISNLKSLINPNINDQSKINKLNETLMQREEEIKSLEKNLKNTINRNNELEIKNDKLLKFKQAAIEVVTELNDVQKNEQPKKAIEKENETITEKPSFYSSLAATATNAATFFRNPVPVNAEVQDQNKRQEAEKLIKNRTTRMEIRKLFK